MKLRSCVPAPGWREEGGCFSSPWNITPETRKPRTAIQTKLKLGALGSHQTGAQGQLCLRTDGGQLAGITGPRRSRTRLPRLLQGLVLGLLVACPCPRPLLQSDSSKHAPAFPAQAGTLEVAWPQKRQHSVQWQVTSAHPQVESKPWSHKFLAANKRRLPAAQRRGRTWRSHRTLPWASCCPVSATSGSVVPPNDT